MTPVEIRDLRQRLGLTQRALGELCGVKRITVEKWERGEYRPSGPSLLHLSRLKAKAPPDDDKTD